MWFLHQIFFCNYKAMAINNDRFLFFAAQVVVLSLKDDSSLPETLDVIDSYNQWCTCVGLLLFWLLFLFYQLVFSLFLRYIFVYTPQHNSLFRVPTKLFYFWRGDWQDRVLKLHYCYMTSKKSNCSENKSQLSLRHKFTTLLFTTC